MKIADRKVVTINYTLTNEQGKVLDSSKGREPLAYIHGVGGLIPGLESALDGKSPGDALDVTIAPEDAYGQRDDELMQSVPREVFADVKELEVGMQFRAESPDGPRVVTIVALDGDQVKVDGNHPLAGATLHFDVDVIDVRDATQQELDHGHVHGTGGHHH